MNRKQLTLNWFIFLRFLFGFSLVLFSVKKTFHCRRYIKRTDTSIYSSGVSGAWYVFFFMLVFSVIKLILSKMVLVIYKFTINGQIKADQSHSIIVLKNVWDFLFTYNGPCPTDRKIVYVSLFLLCLILLVLYC